MKKLLLIAMTAAVVLPAGAAEAAPAPKPTPTLNMNLSRTLITFGDTVTVSGQLAGVAIPAGGANITLQENPFPFKSFKQKATVKTDAGGGYFFVVQPGLYTQYRVRSNTNPAVTTAPQLVKVRHDVKLSVSDDKPRRGKKIIFSGFSNPPNDGLPVKIQRRVRGGDWVTIANTGLFDAGPTFPLSSAFFVRIRVFHSGTYRARVSGTLAFAPGTAKRKIKID
jgi:hypothetical protein